MNQMTSDEDDSFLQIDSRIPNASHKKLEVKINAFTYVLLAVEIDILLHSQSTSSLEEARDKDSYFPWTGDFIPWLHAASNTKSVFAANHAGLRSTAHAL